MNRAELEGIFRRLSAPFPDEAIERTKGDVTRKGYDTTGFRYQFVVDRLNEVLGLDGWRTETSFEVSESRSSKDRAIYEAVCDMRLVIGACGENGVFAPVAIREGTGGHAALSKADARKGAYTNALKKTAAMFGCGGEAYRGTIDGDNRPAPNDFPAPWVDERRDKRAAAPTPSDRSSGRLSSGQLAKLRELVDEVGGDWARYRDHVREQHGLSVEYVDRKLASTLIEGLIATARKRRANGNGEGVKSP